MLDVLSGGRVECGLGPRLSAARDRGLRAVAGLDDPGPGEEPLVLRRGVHHRQEGVDGAVVLAPRRVLLDPADVGEVEPLADDRAAGPRGLPGPRGGPRRRAAGPVLRRHAGRRDDHAPQAAVRACRSRCRSPTRRCGKASRATARCQWAARNGVNGNFFYESRCEDPREDRASTWRRPAQHDWPDRLEPGRVQGRAGTASGAAASSPRASSTSQEGSVGNLKKAGEGEMALWDFYSPFGFSGVLGDPGEPFDPTIPITPELLRERDVIFQGSKQRVLEGILKLREDAYGGGDMCLNLRFESAGMSPRGGRGAVLVLRRGDPARAAPRVRRAARASRRRAELRAAARRPPGVRGLGRLTATWRRQGSRPARAHRQGYACGSRRRRAARRPRHRPRPSGPDRGRMLAGRWRRRRRRGAGVSLNRGAGRGCMTPPTSWNVPRAALWGCAAPRPCRGPARRRPRCRGRSCSHWGACGCGTRPRGARGAPATRRGRTGRRVDVVEPHPLEHRRVELGLEPADRDVAVGGLVDGVERHAAVEQIRLALERPRAGAVEPVDEGHQQRGPVGHRGVDDLSDPGGPGLQDAGEHADGEQHPAAAEVADEVQRHGGPLRPARSPQGAGQRDVGDVVAGSGRTGRPGPSRSCARRRAPGCGPGTARGRRRGAPRPPGAAPR